MNGLEKVLIIYFYLDSMFLRYSLAGSQYSLILVIRVLTSVKKLCMPHAYRRSPPPAQAYSTQYVHHQIQIKIILSKKYTPCDNQMCGIFLNHLGGLFLGYSHVEVHSGWAKCLNSQWVMKHNGHWVMGVHRQLIVGRHGQSVGAKE